MPLNADERAIVEGDEEKIEGFIRKLKRGRCLTGMPVR
jgi:hypothetical protein